jgi:hypothetical protein
MEIKIAVASGGLQLACPRGVAASVLSAPAVLTKTTQAIRNGDHFKGESFTRFVAAKARAVLSGSSIDTFAAQEGRGGRAELAKACSRQIDPNGQKHRENEQMIRRRK